MNFSRAAQKNLDISLVHIIKRTFSHLRDLKDRSPYLKCFTKMFEKLRFFESRHADSFGLICFQVSNANYKSYFLINIKKFRLDQQNPFDRISFDIKMFAYHTQAFGPGLS